MSLFLIFVTALIVGYSGSLVPGPMFTLVVAKSAQHGAWSGIAISAGHAALEALLLMGLAVGLTQVLSISSVAAGIALAGGVVMAFTGAGMVAQAVRGRLSVGSLGGAKGHEREERSTLSSRTAFRLAGLGALVSISNPYFLLWWVTVGSAYFISAALFGVWGVLVFFVGHILSDFTWFGVIGYVAAYGTRFMSIRTYRVFVGICGVALVGIATYFMARGFMSITDSSWPS